MVTSFENVLSKLGATNMIVGLVEEGVVSPGRLSTAIALILPRNSITTALADKPKFVVVPVFCPVLVIASQSCTCWCSSLYQIGPLCVIVVYARR